MSIFEDKILHFMLFCNSTHTEVLIFHIHVRTTAVNNVCVLRLFQFFPSTCLIATVILAGLLLTCSCCLSAFTGLCAVVSYPASILE